MLIFLGVVGLWWRGRTAKRTLKLESGRVRKDFSRMRLIVVGDNVSLKQSTHEQSSTFVSGTSTDRKGIKRGPCEEDGCADCDSYVCDPLKGSQCQYCGCYPTKHRRLDDGSTSTCSASKEESLSKPGSPSACSVIKEESLSNPALPKDRFPPEIHVICNSNDATIYEVGNNITFLDGVANLENVDPNPGSCMKFTNHDRGISSTTPLYLTNEDSSLQNDETQKRLNGDAEVTFRNIGSLTSREHMYEFCVPSHLPVPNTLGKGPINREDQLFMIKWMSWCLWNFKLVSKDDFLGVAKLALQKYPGLESVLSEGKGVEGLAHSLRLCLGLKNLSDLGKIKALSKSKVSTADSHLEPAKEDGIHQEHFSIPFSESLADIKRNVGESTSRIELKSTEIKGAFLSKPIARSKSKITPESKSISITDSFCALRPQSKTLAAVEAVPVSVKEACYSKQFENCRLHIQKEFVKVHPSPSIFYAFLSSCRRERRQIAKWQDPLVLLEDLPCLCSLDYMLWEFIQQEQLKCSVDDLKKRWRDAIPNMYSYFVADPHSSDPVIITEDAATESILKHITLPKFFGVSDESKSNRSSKIIEVFEVEGPTSQLPFLPPKEDPPQLFTVANKEQETTITFVYVGGRSVFKGDIGDALAYLVAFYNVFSITPGTDIEAPMSFLFGIFMREKAENKYKNHASVLEALQYAWENNA